MFEVVFLGTSASAPSIHRGLSANMVLHREYRFLIDCGEGTQRQILQSGLGFKRLDKILLTHGHFDHVGANKRIKEATGAPLVIHEGDAPMLGHLIQAAASFGLAAENSPMPDEMPGIEIEPSPCASARSSTLRTALASLASSSPVPQTGPTAWIT